MIEKFDLEEGLSFWGAGEGLPSQAVEVVILSVYPEGTPVTGQYGGRDGALVCHFSGP